MRIGVFSDTHGDLSRLCLFENALRPLDLVLHCGDHARDGERLGEYFACPYKAVRGNCDFSGDYPIERVVSIAGKRFLLIHGHLMRDELSLAYRAEELNCDAAFTGHSHVPFLSAWGKILLCNPGSLSQPRMGSKPSCSLVEIIGGEVYIKMINH